MRPPRSCCSSSCLGSGLLEHGLHGEVDVHLVADEDPAAVERDVEVHAEVLAVDDAVGLEAETLAAPRVLADAQELDLELDGLGDALEGEVADDGGAVEGGRGEAHLAELLHVEEVSGAQVAVALLVAGVDRVQVHGRVGAGVLERLTGRELALELSELSGDLAHQVANREPDLGVAGVDGPGAGGDVGTEGSLSGDRHAVSVLTLHGGACLALAVIQPSTNPSETIFPPLDNFWTGGPTLPPWHLGTTFAGSPAINRRRGAPTSWAPSC